MANKVTIEVEALLVDQVTGKTKYVINGLDGIEEAARDAQKALDQVGKKKVHPIIDADNNKFLRKMRESESRIARIAGKTATATLKVVDKGVDIINKAEAGLKNITRKTWTTVVKIKDLATAPLRGLQNTLFNIKSLVLAITAGLAAKQFVLNPINLADQYSGAKIGFSTLLGETEAQLMMDKIDQFAKETPFKTSGVIGNVQKMMAYGWDVDRVIDDMKTIGDAAASTGKGDQGLESIVYALSEIRSKGKLSTQEINQLASAGIKAKAYLAEGLGFGTDDAGMKKLAEALEDGAIGANQAIDLILEGMKEFNGMMDATANETVEGLKSQLEDAFEINIARRWGQGLQDGAKRGLGSVVGLLDEAQDALEKFGDTMYDLGKTASNWVADRLETTVKRITDITDSFEFENADLGEKISMLWKGVVKDPLSEWFDNLWRGEENIQKAEEFGRTLAENLTKGILAILGVTDIFEEGGLSESGGANIAQGFAKGFVDGFDVSAITDKLVEAISNVWNALPTWAKWLVGGYVGGKAMGAVANFAGGVASFVGSRGTMTNGAVAGASGLLGMIGRPGYGYDGNVKGYGILGGLSSIGYRGVSLLGGSTTAAGLGMGMATLGGAGAVAGGVTLASGAYDLYQGYKSEDEIEAKASKTSGYTKIGGVATGAAMGAFIGGPVGALIGAGIGGLVGWVAGGQMADDIRGAKYESEELKKVLEDEKATQEEINNALAKAKWENAREHFGDIKLSLSEINRLVGQIVWGDDLGSFEKFQSATSQAAASLESMKAAMQTTDRWMWKAGLGVKFNADEQEAIIASFDEYVNSAQAYLENKHYEFSASAELLLDLESKEGKGILEAGNAFYLAEQEKLTAAGEELGKALTDALADGIINADEEKAIIAAQTKIAEITQKISEAETAAEIELIKVKYSGDNLLDKDSFDAFMASMSTALEERFNAADEAYTVQVKNLKLQFPNGGPEYEEKLQTLAEGYKATVEGAKVEIRDVELSMIGSAYSDVLGEDAVADLNKALQNAINTGLTPIEISDQKMAELLNIKLDGNGETISNIKEYLTGVLNHLGLMELNADVQVNPDVTTAPDTTDKVVAAVDKTVPETVDSDTTLNVTALKGNIFGLNLTASDLGVQSSYSFSPRVNVNPILSAAPLANITAGLYGDGNGYRGGIFGGSSAAESFYRGGIVRGGSKLIEVAEEGSPEMVIPLSSQRRERGLALWEKAGEMLNVPGFFRGGLTSGGDEGIRFHGFGSEASTSGGQSIQIDVGGITLEIHVNGTDAQSIAEAIKAQVADIAEDVAGVMADAFAAQFENTPVRGGAA